MRLKNSRLTREIARFDFVSRGTLEATRKGQSVANVSEDDDTVGCIILALSKRFALS